MLPFRPILFIVLLFSSLNGQDANLLSQLKLDSEGIDLWWAGHNSWIIKSGDLVISTDLLLEFDMRSVPPPINTEELAEVLDISFITHGHNDHFNRQATEILIEKSDCIFVIPQSCVHLAKELNIPDHRLIVATPRTPFKIKGIHVEPIRAIHGNENFAIYYDANLEDCGYVIDINGTRFLQPGDSYLLEDHLFLKDIDVLFFSPTEHNMYIDRSVILINTLNPQFIFPQHHSTIEVTPSSRFWAKGYQDEVKIRLSQALKDRYHILQPGLKVKIK